MYFSPEEEDTCLNKYYEPKSSICTAGEKYETSFPDCFHETSIMWGPSIFLWLVIPFYFFYLASGGKQSNEIGRLGKAKMATSIFLATLSTIQVTLQRQMSDGMTNSDEQVFVNWTRISSFILVILVLKLENRKGLVNSIPLLLFWTFMLAASSVSMYYMIIEEEFTKNLPNFIIASASFCGVLFQFILSCFADNNNRLKTAHQEESLHPEDKASIVNILTLEWITSFAWKSYRNGLEEDDVTEINAADRCKPQYQLFEEKWKRENQKFELEGEKNRETPTENGDTTQMKPDDTPVKTLENKPSLLMALIRAYGLKYFALQIVKGGFELGHFVYPLLMELFMKHIETRATEPAWKGYALVVSLFLTSAIIHTMHGRVWCAVRRNAKNVKCALKLAVFNKALTTTNESKKEKTSGELVSLISEDVEKVVNASTIGFFIVEIPLQISLALYMLYNQLGVAALLGFSFLLLFIPVNTWVANKLKALIKTKDSIKDERVKVMNEVINGIKVLKLYAWEKSFINKICGIRNKEVELGKSISYCHGGINSMFSTIPFLVQLIGFSVFIFMDGYLDATKAFVAISLFELLNAPFGIMALVIPEFTQGAISLKRLNEFLSNKDIPEDVVSKDSTADAAVSIKDGTFTWERASEKTTLEDINLTIPKGSLVAIVGMVGSGKSSVLHAMLGEMEKVKGKVTVQSNTAYVPQEAWILNAPLRDNVLFGSDFKTKYYNKVVNACALKEDFKLLAAADKTEIGEKGINLSGGQKQRVSLARAVYSDADIFLLDDPLSAVDAHVGKHIFNKVLGHQGLLKNKTRILVTHGVHWLPFVDNIIVMKEGKISERGTYKELLTHNGAFAQFLNEVFSKETQQVDDDAEVTKIRKKIFTRLSSVNENEPLVTVDSDEEASTTIDEVKSENSSSSEDESPEERQNNDEKVDEDENIDDEQDVKSEEDEDNTAEKKEAVNDYAKIIEEEDTERGNVSFDVYKQYIKAVGPWFLLSFVVMFAILLISREMRTLWLSKWTEDPMLSNRSLTTTEEYKAASWMYITFFAGIGSVEMIMSFLFIIAVQSTTFNAANYLHGKLLTNVMKSPMSFFDTTPSGRIITRFSKDIQSIDNLQHCIQGYIRSFGNVINALILIIILTPRILPFMALVTIVYLLFQRIFLVPARQLRRFVSKHSSPILVHFTETLNGVTSVRAYNAQQQFIDKMEKALEKHLKFELLQIYLHYWFELRSTVLASSVELVAGLFVLYDADISPALAALILMKSSEFVHCIGWFFNITTHTEQELVSLERVIEYSNKPNEAEWELPETAPVMAWPESGEVNLTNYQIRYREGLDLVLKGITCNIRSGEKVGVVGRTGAGKSSLMMALFRLIEAAAGEISVDGHVISELGLHDLRKKITILPQEPVIFGGSLRMNLDPFNESTTEGLWEALEHSHLKTHVEGLPGQLDFDCGEGGKNLSVGQRQLVCLARTLLRKTKILVLDEATAAVDIETDEMIQKTICTEFKGCTVLTIAHRLNTIINYDRILVLDQGKVKEFDTPKNLLADPNSAFYSMAKDAKLV